MGAVKMVIKQLEVLRRYLEVMRINTKYSFERIESLLGLAVFMLSAILGVLIGILLEVMK